jgi:hypothetical protein
MSRSHDATAAQWFEELSTTHSRRLGARVATSFSVFVTNRGQQRVRARATELSTTGVLLDFRYADACDIEGLLTFELAVPGLIRPIRTAARRVRSVGKLLAFEFLAISRDDRLTLAEHIDRVVRTRTR